MPNLSNQLELQQCPHCGTTKPMLTLLWSGNTQKHSGGNQRTWKTYLCSTCGGVVLAASTQDGQPVREMYPSGVKETFDLEYLPDAVRDDFSEALDCYSSACFNAFAAMARRTVQSVSSNLGAEGKDRVLIQLKDLKEMSHIDDETFDILNQIIIAGHDGSHPYLPKLSPERAAILLELMKDVLYQIYIRKAKIKQAMELRKQTIAQGKSTI